MVNPRSPRKRATQADVGRLANVSAAVVSAVVNGRNSKGVRVSDQTTERVWEAIRQLGYVPNAAARTLAGGRTDILGVFTYEALFPTDSMSFYHPFLIGIEEAVEELGRHLLLFTGSNSGQRRRTIFKDGVNSLRVADGAVLLGQDEDRDELAELQRDGFPFVFVGRREIIGGEPSYAAADYEGAAYRLVTHVVEQGHRRIARVRGDWEHEAIADRGTGFARACADLASRLDVAEVAVAPTDEAITGTLDMLIAHGVTCVLADDYAAAQAVCVAAEQAGLRVPRDLSVAALGDFPGTFAGGRSIMTVTTPRREMGAAAIRLLADLIDNPDEPGPRRVVIDCGLRPGDTVGPPPTA